jgi:hypothetical protein
MQIREYEGVDAKISPAVFVPLVLLHEQDLQNHLGDARPL